METTGFWRECQYSSLCRLQASLFSLRLGHARGKTTLSCFLILSRRFTTHSAAGMQHTACGILPNEQIEVRLHRKRNGYDCFIASGNTRFTNKVCELIESVFPPNKKWTAYGVPFDNWILTRGVNILALFVWQASLSIFEWSMRTRSANRVCELFEPKLHQIVKGTTLRRPLYYLVETTGLEPVTPCMSSKYSNQLSYASVSIYYTHYKNRCQYRFWVITKKTRKNSSKLIHC